jgi:hypothetical protein
VRDRYADFGPTLAAEKLTEHHGCSVSRETLRGWMMIADGLWHDRRHRLPSPHQPRRRRDCLGELVQMKPGSHAFAAAIDDTPASRSSLTIRSCIYFARRVTFQPCADTPAMATRSWSPLCWTHNALLVH